MEISNESFDARLVDFIELIDFTLSTNFIDRWSMKYSVKFLKHFQVRLVKAIHDERVLKLSTLYTYLTKKCKYSSEQVLNFFESIDVDIYNPLISGFVDQLKIDG